MSWFKRCETRETLQSQSRRVALDFMAVLATTTTVIFLINVGAAQAVPIPVFSLLLPFDFGLTQSAVEVVHGGLAGGDRAAELPVAAANATGGALAMTLACCLFAAMSAVTLMLYRRLRRTQAWRWSAHFE